MYPHLFTRKDNHTNAWFLNFESNSEGSQFNYAELNREINKESEVKTSELKITDELSFKRGGISYELEASLKKAGMEANAVKATLFEALHAMDESLSVMRKTDPRVPRLDGLEEYLKGKGGTHFSINNGTIAFLGLNGIPILELNLISSRQIELKKKWEKDKAWTRLSTEEKTKRLQLQTVAERIKLARSSIDAPNDNNAIEFTLPPAETSNEPYLMPLTYWIETSEAPQGLPAHLRGEVRCMGYVGGRLTERMGWKNLVASGFKGERHAWQLKADLQKKNSVDEVASMQSYLRISRGTIISVKKETESYKRDLITFRTKLQKSLEDPKAKDTPHLMTLRYLHSDYADESAAYNSKISQEKRSLNTHILECLGEGKGPLKGIIIPGETLKNYVNRSLKISPNEEFLLDPIKIWINDKPFTFKEGRFVDETNEEPILEGGEQIHIEDIWFAHHKGGAQIDSFTALMASGEYDVVDVLRIKPDLEGGNALPAPREIPGVKILKHIYLRRKQSLKTVFENEISSDPEDWRLTELYWRTVGFNPNKIRPQIEAVPIPDLTEMKAWVEAQGGFAEIEKKSTLKRIAKYNETHPDEQLILVEPGKNPWQQFGEKFEKKLGKTNSSERKHILTAIDLRNKSIDLREFIYSGLKNEPCVGYMKYEAGAIVQINDELVDQLVHEIEIQRVEASVHVPPNLPVMHLSTFGNKLEETPIPNEVRELIENATDDPSLRMALTLILINEQLRGENRGLIFDRENVFGYEPKTLGLFQVSAYPKEMGKYGFTDLKTYRNALLTDKVLNTKVALDHLKEARNGLNFYLEQNSEAEPEKSARYMTALCTLYNRPYRAVWNGLMQIQAQKVCKVLSIRGKQAMEIKKVTQIRGENSDEDTTKTANLWMEIAKNLNLNGLSEEQINSDIALIKNERYAFFRSETYLTIKDLYQQTSKESLNLLLDEKDLKETSALNYGYSVTRNGEVERILNYSAEVNAPKLKQLKETAPSNVT